MTLPLSLFLLACVFATSILSGVLGMAGGMVLMGVLAWLLPVSQAMILHAIAQFFANASRALIHHRHIHKSSLLYYMAGMAATASFFVTVAFMPDKFVLFLILGLTPFLPYALPKNLKPDFTRPPQAFLCGVIVTGLQLTGGVSGPLLDVFFQHTGLTRHQVVSTKAATQSVSHFLKFFYFGFIVSELSVAADGLPLWLCLGVIPAAMAGTAVSKALLEKISDGQFFRATQIVLAVIGIVYLQKALMLWLERGGLS